MATAIIETNATEIVLQGERDGIVAQANAIVVRDAESYTASVDFIKEIKAAAQKVSAYFDPDVKAAHALHKSLVQKRDEFLAPLNRAEVTVKAKAATWQREEEEKQREAQRQLEEAARKAEEDRRLAMAAEAERQGKTELAEQILDAPIDVAPVVLPSRVPTISGASVSERWDAEIVAVEQIPQAIFVEAARASKTMLEGLTGAIRKMVQVSGGSRHIPGVRNFKTASMSVRN